MDSRRLRITRQALGVTRSPGRGAGTGESLTDAVIHSLEERLERLKGRRSAPDLAETLMAISRRSSALPDLDTRTAEEILGYDEKGTFR